MQEMQEMREFLAFLTFLGFRAFIALRLITRNGISRLTKIIAFFALREFIFLHLLFLEKSHFTHFSHFLILAKTIYCTCLVSALVEWLKQTTPT